MSHCFTANAGDLVALFTWIWMAFIGAFGLICLALYLCMNDGPDRKSAALAFFMAAVMGLTAASLAMGALTVYGVHP